MPDCKPPSDHPAQRVRSFPMKASTLLENDRRALFGHRLRGMPAFWLGFLSLLLSLLGLLSRQRDIPEIRSFGRRMLDFIPPGDDYWVPIFHFQFSPPFATTATFLGLALLLWGWIELAAAGRIKRELRAVEDAKRKSSFWKSWKPSPPPPRKRPEVVILRRPPCNPPHLT